MSSEVQERILHTAYRLFYQNGYRATGINQIIRESDVAKATFYHHYKSKEDLALAYLDLRSRIYFRSIINEINRLAKRPIDKPIVMYEAFENIYLGLTELDEGRISEGMKTGYHGCHYIKMDMESPSNKVKETVREHQKKVLIGIQFLLDEAIQEKELKKETNSKQLSIHLGMLVHGAILQTRWDSNISYFKEASEVAKILLKPWSLVKL